MRSGWLTGILLGVGVIVLVAVPQLRDSLDILRYNLIGGQGTWLSKAKVERVAQQNPQDPQMWLGFAECGASSQPPGAYTYRGMNPAYPWDQSWSPPDAYQRAIALAPNSPVLYLRYALHFLADWGSLGRKEGWGAGIEEEPERTAAEMENLRQAERMLRRARRLDPANAACDYLLAYIHLARHQDKQAFAFLQEATSKPHWSLGRQAATKAVLRLLEATGSSSLLLETHAINIEFANGHPINAPLRSLALVLAGLGEQFRARGHHQQAILCYEAGVHLGHVMRRDAYTLIDGLVALAITPVAGGPFLSEEERQQIIEETPITDEEAHRAQQLLTFSQLVDSLGKGDLRQANKWLRQLDRQETARSQEQRKEQERFHRQQQERMKQMEQARVANFAAYMKEQGRPDLGELYQRETHAANQWKKQCRTTTDSDLSATRAALSR